MSDYPETELIVKNTEWKEGVGKRGPWKMFVLTDNSGMSYSTFERDILKDSNGMKVVNSILPGYALKIAYEQNGQYRNLKRIIEYEPPVADSGPASQRQETGKDDKMSKEDWAAKDNQYYWTQLFAAVCSRSKEVSFDELIVFTNLAFDEMKRKAKGQKQGEEDVETPDRN